MSSPLRRAIDAIVAEHPSLTAAGWNRPDSVDEHARAEMYVPCFEQAVLDVLVFAALSPVEDSYSYELKHAAEAKCGRYVPSGAAAVAMLLLGFEAQRNGGLHCTFVSKTGPHPLFCGPNTYTFP